MKKNQDINNLILTTHEVASLVMKIDELQSELYSANSRKIADKLRTPDFSAIADFIEGQGVSFDEKQSLTKALQELKSTVTNLPNLRLKVAEPNLSSASWTKIFLWLKDNVMKGSPFLLDTEIDPAILGGIVIYWQGNVKDFSLKNNLAKFFVKEAGHVFG